MKYHISANDINTILRNQNILLLMENTDSMGKTSQTLHTHTWWLNYQRRGIDIWRKFNFRLPIDTSNLNGLVAFSGLVCVVQSLCYIFRD